MKSAQFLIIAVKYLLETMVMCWGSSFSFWFPSPLLDKLMSDLDDNVTTGKKGTFSFNATTKHNNYNITIMWRKNNDEVTGTLCCKNVVSHMTAI